MSNVTKSKFKIFFTTLYPLWIIVTIGAILRFTNLNWDGGARIHPDEALIVNGALAIKFFSNLFPGFHDYNGLSIYLLKLFTLNETAPETITISGRFLSALISTTTIPIIYLLGKRMWNKDIGLLAAFLFTFTPLSIQLAHFYTTESILLFLLTVLLYGCVMYTYTPTIKHIFWIGCVSGLLLATKNTAYLFLPIPLSIVFFRKKHLLIFVCLTLLFFFIGSPYSFLDFQGYLARSHYLSDVVSGRLLMDWTMQFQYTNWTFWIQNILLGFGPIIFFGFLCTKAPRIFMLWSLAYIIFLGNTYLKFTRYSAPLIPLMCLYTAKVLWDIRQTKFGLIVVSTVILLQIVWGAMFFHIYLVPHTSIQAENWIHQHIPKDSILLQEEWNSIIRFKSNYIRKSFNFYSPDTPTKFQTLQNMLKQSDYVIIESPKVKNTVIRLSAIYPNSNTFYTHLANGTLGFTKIAEFSSYPMFGPLKIDDSSAEETWYAFDHPTITIYKNITSP